jgi:putative transcriptional regulator
MSEPYHYTECGLEDVYLVNGFKTVQTPFGEGVQIVDTDALHMAIGLNICDNANTITSEEFRFLRVEMSLSQKNLAQFMGVSDQTIGRIEKGKTESKELAGRFLKALYLEHIEEDSSLKKLCLELAQIDNEDDIQKTFELTDTSGWNIAA